MVRPREFNYETAVEHAMQLFWAQGYEETSMSQLLAAMDLGKGSFYNTFGSKAALYQETLERYRRVMMPAIAGPLTRENAGWDAIVEFMLQELSRMVHDNDLRGCFLANAAVENCGDDASVNAQVCNGLSDMTGYLERALRRAQADGDARPDFDPRTGATQLILAGYGAMVLGKTRMAMDQVCLGLQMTLDGLRSR